MSATRTEAVTASEHLGMLNSSLEFVNQKLHNNLTRPNQSPSVVIFFEICYHVFIIISFEYIFNMV